MVNIFLYDTLTESMIGAILTKLISVLSALYVALLYTTNTIPDRSHKIR